MDNTAKLWDIESGREMCTLAVCLNYVSNSLFTRISVYQTIEKIFLTNIQRELIESRLLFYPR